MQITSIKASKVPNQVWITFSDSSFIPFFIDDVVKLSLVKNQEIDDLKFEQIIKTCLLFKSREYSLRQVAISPKIEKIISQKINIYLRKIILRYKIKFNNLNEIVKETVDYLKSKNLLNESDFVSYFVKRNHKKSRQQIIYLLRQLGVDNQFLSNLNFNQESDIDKIKKIISVKKNMDKLKLKALLYRRGFNISDINAAFDDGPKFR